MGSVAIDWEQLLWGALAGDMGALTMLFVLMSPIVLVIYAGVLIYQDITKNKEKDQ